MPHDTIALIPVNNPTVFAFRIRGEVDSEDMQRMASTMQDAFDGFDRVSMLLLFDDYEGQELGASLHPGVVTTQLRALANVEKYAVVGAPGGAKALINVMDKIIPVDARTFDRSDEEAAWDFVGARPLRGA
jgi:hypothetical protein